MALLTVMMCEWLVAHVLRQLDAQPTDSGNTNNVFCMEKLLCSAKLCSDFIFTPCKLR